MLQNIACIDNRLYRQHFTIQFRNCHHVYRHYENSTHIYHIYYSMYDIELSILNKLWTIVHIYVYYQISYDDMKN